MSFKFGIINGWKIRSHLKPSDFIRKLNEKSSADYKRIGYAFYKDLKYFLRRSESAVRIFILGCQRSGSSMLLHAFARDASAKVLGEFSVLNTKDTSHGIRLNPLEEVEKQLSRFSHPIIAIKPLVESQNVLEILDHIRDSKVIWLFRNYNDVASSNLKKWGIQNGFNNLEPIVRQEKNNWRSEKISEATIRIVREFCNKKLSPHDAAALFWWVRNRIFFERNLEQNQKVLCCSYESLVGDPSNKMRSIYDFVGASYPGDHVIKKINANSVGISETFVENQEIQELCEATWQDLSQLSESSF